MVGLFLLTIATITNLPYFRIKSVGLTGDDLTEATAEIESLVGRSIFSRAISRTASQVSSNFRVEKFECRKGLPDSLKCSLKLKEPLAVWQSGNLSFLIDKDGVIFTEQAQSIPGQFVIEDKFLLPVKIGAVVLSPEIIGHYQALKGMLETSGFVVHRFIINESLFQVSAVVDKADKKSISVMFLLSNNLEESLVTLNNTFDNQAASINSQVDLRVAGYVYVK